MFKLLKGGFCFTPEYIGKKDILVANGMLCKIDGGILTEGLWDIEVIDCSDRIVCPGFIDQHVHITGGGGEEGPASRIPELMLGEVVSAGVTTLVGVLGVDGISRSMHGLLAKARALELEGISTYIYTGSYQIPVTTLTGRALSDLVLIDKVIGIGEVAISDYRSSHPGIQQLKELAGEAMVGGLLGGKAGVLHLHVGDGKSGLRPLFQLLEESDFPMDMFVPTHLNRNKHLFGQAVEYARNGGTIDLTAGEKSGKGYSVPDAVNILLEMGVDIERITISSDGNGSIPAGREGGQQIGQIMEMFVDIRSCILDKKIEMGTILKAVTSNVAKLLKLYPRKGLLSVGSDADIVVLNRNDFSIDKLMANGEILINDGSIIKKGRFEK